MEKSFPMDGGDGNSSSMIQSSSFLKGVMNAMKDKIKEEIEQKLEVKDLISSSESINIADLGCSIGPNTIMCMENIIHVIKLKYQSQEIPEFQVFFNDLSSNDFNTLFSFLRPEKPYFAAGVPGSFHGRLFPESFIHFVHCSHALQYLSKLPEEVEDPESPAWNKGRTHYRNAPEEVGKAYSDQFARDFGLFLDCRAKEIVPGGLMVLTLAPIRDGKSRIPTLADLSFDRLGSCLVDMAKEVVQICFHQYFHRNSRRSRYSLRINLTQVNHWEINVQGLISEAQVDSFNMPFYIASEQEVTELVDKNGSFKIERSELLDMDYNIRALNLERHKEQPKISFQTLFSKHFGSEIMDELFRRNDKKTEEFYSQLSSVSTATYQLFVALKRK